MRASELAAELKRLIEKHGDLTVYVSDWQEMYKGANEASSVEYDRQVWLCDKPVNTGPEGFLLHAGDDEI